MGLDFDTVIIMKCKLPSINGNNFIHWKQSGVQRIVQDNSVLVNISFLTVSKMRVNR